LFYTCIIFKTHPPLSTGGALTLANKYQYNQKETNDDFGLWWSDYGARWYDLQRGVWGQIDPLTEKYVAWSGYNYGAGNPMRFIDPDGRTVKGFSIDKDGNVQVDSKKASKNAQTIYNAMSKTTMGAAGFKKWVSSETKFTLKLSAKAPDGQHGKTLGFGSAKGDKDYYEKATVTISTERIGDRFDKVKSDEELINVVSTHEVLHGTDKEQIKKDKEVAAMKKADGSRVGYTWEQETKTLNTEYSAWKQYRQMHGGDATEFKNDYENPNAGAIDGAGQPKPAFYGVDPNGNSLSNPQEEE
jgi:RHS repeat-associated protein